MHEFSMSVYGPTCVEPPPPQPPGPPARPRSPDAGPDAGAPATPGSGSFWGMGKNLGGWLSKKAEGAGAAAAKAGGARAPRNVQGKAIRAKYEARKESPGQ